MKIIKPLIRFEWMTVNPLKVIERAARTCYQSQDSIGGEKDTEKFIKKVLDRGHESVVEHASMSYRIICDRGVTHEIIRHRLFSYSQESTRYCNYGNSGEIQVIKPPFKTGELGYEEYLNWESAMNAAEKAYLRMVNRGVSPQLARSVLPNSLKTEIVVTGNFREWRHFFKLRAHPKAHPQMQEIAYMILNDARQRVSVVFDNVAFAC